MTATKEKTTSVVPFAERFQIATNGNNIGALLAQNLGGEEVNARDILDRIKVPSGGATFWSVPTLDGDKPEKALEGIIVYTNRRRAYWASRTATGTPPDCVSDDCITGIGTPGGDCITCPLGGKTAWGTATKQDGSPAKGKACKESRQIFLLMPGHKLPVVVVAPPTSLRAMQAYLGKELTFTREVPHFGCITRLELVKTPMDGNDVAVIKPSFVSALSTDEVKAVADYARSLAPIFAATKANEETEEKGAE